MADELEQTADERAALAASEVQTLDRPHAVFQEEAGAMLDEIERDDALRAKLLKTKVTATQLKQARVLLMALLQAQRAWTRVRARRDEQALVDAIDAAEVLRADVLEAVEYALEDDREAVGRIKDIRAGEGVPDLIEDLGDLRQLVEDYAAVMQADELFDYKETLDAIDDLLKTLMPLRSDKVFDAERLKAKDTRDRAWTLAIRAIRAIRKGGRRAFSKEPVRLKIFQSHYEISAKRRSRAAEQDTPS